MKDIVAARTWLPAVRDSWFIPFETQFNKIFDELLSDFFQSNTLKAVKATTGYPKIDITEDENNFVLMAAVPGVKLEDLSVELLPDENESKATAVRISGSMSQAYRCNDSSAYYCRELHKSRFSRVISLPDYLEDEEPMTELQNGILILKWKRKKSVEYTNKPKKIKINPANNQPP